MKIPQSFKDVIASTFYDKPITFYSRENTVDIEGGNVLNQPTNEVTILCNANQVTHERLIKEYGIDLDASLMLTCSELEKLSEDLYLTYMSDEYVVKKVLHYDSHMKVLCVHND